MGEMADMAIKEMEEEELDRMEYRRGMMSQAEAYKRGIINELGYDIYPLFVSIKGKRQGGREMIEKARKEIMGELALLEKRIKKGEMRGEAGVMRALEMLVEIANARRQIREMEAGETRELKREIEEIKKEYRPMYEVLDPADERLREVVLEEHEGTETVAKEGVGELVFPQRWTWEVEDERRVERQWMSVNEKAVGEAVRNGIRAIKGIKIYQKRGIEVRPQR